MLHPQTTAWTLYDDDKNEGLNELNEKLLDVMKQLEEKHIAYHLGDETLMERHGSVDNGKLIIGEQSYTYIINPGCEVFLENTKLLLNQFEGQGGIFITAAELPINEVVSDPKISYKKVTYDTYNVHFFVNTSKERKTARIMVSGKNLDIYSGELSSFNPNYEFEPWGSLIVIEDGNCNDYVPEKNKTYILPQGEFSFVKPAENVLTLDRCDYYFDGVLQEKNGYVLNICERANALERKVHIHQDYHVLAEYLPKTLFLVCETPDLFNIEINGRQIVKNDCGYFRDKSFRKINITPYIQLGDNIISFDCDFLQSQNFYEQRRKAFLFEGPKNKLAYDMEIESVYLLGDFTVKTEDKWEKLDKNAVRYRGTFTISEPKEKVLLKNLERQGYPFFCGEMCLKGELMIKGENPYLRLNIKGINAVTVEIEDKKRVILTDNEIPLKDFGVSGRVNIKITLVNNLRNMLGPHHLTIGEEYAVGPYTFFKEPCVWNLHPEEFWDDGYCFVETGMV